MTNPRKFCLILAYALIGFSSCASNCGGQSLKLSVDMLKIDLWLNLMPGGPGSFHLAGEIKLKNRESSAITKLSISNVSVFQSAKRIYSFIPFILVNDQSIDSLNLKQDEEKTIVLTSREALPIDKNLDESSFVDVVITFKDSEENIFIHKIEDIFIQKVY